MSALPNRFVVRELEGFRISGKGVSGAHPKTPPGLTVWVADEAAHGREVQVWRTESLFGRTVEGKRAEIRTKARALARRLNLEPATVH